jgi:hypothetical protein
MLLSFLLMFFASSGHVNESVAAIIEILNVKIEKIGLGPIVPEQIIVLITVGIVGLLGIRRKR